jgi:recombination protein RecA
MPATCRADVEALLRARKLDRTLVPVTSASGIAVAPEMAPTGLATLDRQLGGGLPLGHFSEITGPRSSGRTSLLMALLAAATIRGELVALVDTFDVFDAESMAAAGVRLDRLLWVRGETCTPAFPLLTSRQAGADRAIERAVKAMNLILQAEGFTLVALDLADAPSRSLRRIPMTTWMRLQRVLEGQPAAAVVVGATPMSRSAGGVTLTLTRDSPFDSPLSRLASFDEAQGAPSPGRGAQDNPGSRSAGIGVRNSGVVGGRWATDGGTSLFRGLESEVRIQRARLLPGMDGTPVRLTATAQVA